MTDAHSPPLAMVLSRAGCGQASGCIPLFGGHGDEPLRGLIVWRACQVPIELHLSKSRLSQEVRQFRPSVEPDPEGEVLLLYAAYPNPMMLNSAPALTDDALIQ